MDEESREEHRAAEQLHERARQIRGGFLNQIAVIERSVALLLTHYFCTEDPSKQAIFFNSIASAMSLNAKRSVLIEIVKKELEKEIQEIKLRLSKLKSLLSDLLTARGYNLCDEKFQSRY